MHTPARRPTLRPWYLAAAALTLATRLAPAQPDAQAGAPPLTDAEFQTAYTEVQAIGGMSYLFYVGAAADEAKLDAYLQRLGRAPAPAYVEKLGLKKYNAYAFSIPPALRAAVFATPVGRVSRRFRLQDSWCFVYVAAAKFVPVPPPEQFKDALPNLVRAGTIPAPADVLRARLATIYQAAQVRDVADLARLPADFDVNTVLPSGSTMLSNAAAAGTMDLVAALIDRHANVNQCAATVCPLTLALYAQNAPDVLRLLLDHGANPNITDPDAGAVNTPLALAVLQANGIALAELLILHGANVDGMPGEVPPLVAAAGHGDRAAVELLQRHGADLYRESSAPPLPTNALTAADRAKTDPAFQRWLAQQWQDVARRSGRFDWQGWIEQDGRQTPIGDQPIVIARKPFTLLVRMRPDARLAVAASADRTLFDDARDTQRKDYGPVHSTAAVVADQCEGDERPLFMSGTSANPQLMGGGDRVMIWQDDPRCRAFTATVAVAEGTRFARTIGSLQFYDSLTSVADSRVASLFLVIGTQLPAVFPQFDYAGEKRVELRFR